MLKKKSQVWIETVIYTLIGISIIGVVLGIVKPAIEERKDSLAISQNIEVLNAISSQADDVKNTGEGNIRHVSVKIGKGKMIIDGENDKIGIILDSKYEYSEPDIVINAGGDVEALTIKKGKQYEVNLALNYAGKINITYEGNDVSKTFESAPTAYDIWIKNAGIVNGMNDIDFY